MSSELCPVSGRHPHVWQHPAAPVRPSDGLAVPGLLPGTV